MRGRRRNARWLPRPISRNGLANIRRGTQGGGAANILTRTTKRESPALFRAVLQILVGDREHRIRLDLDVAHDALPRIGIADPGVVAAGLDAGDAQPLVVVDLLVFVVQALVRPPLGLSGRGELEAGDRLRRQIPEPNTLAFGLRERRARYRDQQDADRNQRTPHGDPPRRCRWSN